jgi:PAS domain S-box-containing protein
MSDPGTNKQEHTNHKDSEELAKVQNELKRTYENFLELFDNTLIGFLTIDSNGIIKAANNFTCKLFTLEKYELIGKPFSSFISKEDFFKFFDAVKRTQDAGKNQSYGLKLHNSQGIPFFVNLTISNSFDDNNNIQESKIAITDITQQKNAEENSIQIKRSFEEQLTSRTSELERNIKVLQEARDKAEESNRIKSMFFANMSHELRTPMVGILGFSEVIMSEAKDPDIKEMASLIHSGGTRLLETLNLILDFSKIESEKLNLNYELTNVISVLTDVISIFSETVQKKNLIIKFTPKDKVLNANLDPRLFRQVLNNLLNNAVKYTNEGSIKISISASKETLTLKVKDTGIGIEKDKVDKIFEEFRQVSEGLNRQFSGSGLGLTLTKRFIELMNGTISVNSKVNKGSEFIVELPLAPKESDDYSHINSFAGMKALIVEDDEISYSLLKNILSELCEADIATNLEDAMNKASEKNYDFVIMDINLGGDDTGIDVTRELRTVKGYSRIPIIAVTAYAMKGDKNFFINSGLDAYVSKPFTRTELIETIRKSIDKVSV